MKLDNNAWHVKWFYFVQSIIGDCSEYRRGTSLCHFIRVTMVWGPFVALFYGGVFLGGIGVLTVLPWVVGGPLAMFALWGGIVAVFGLLAIMFYLATEYSPKEGGAVDCVLTYAKAAKAKVCPLVTFDGSNARGI